MRVAPDPADPTHGRLIWPGGQAGCRLGRSGVIPAAGKREGDGATPAGAWPLRRLYYRADRLAAPATALDVTALDPAWCWIDDPADARYNRLVPGPVDGSHERLWRDDRRYDLIVPLGYNDDPPVAGLGSAIFLHLTDDPPGPTAGCVAVDRGTLTTLLAVVGPASRLIIAG